LALLQTDLSALPFLKHALEIHLTRFPSNQNGLSLIENTLLQAVAEGRTKFVDLFLHFGNLHPVIGFGDSQVWLVLKRLTEAEVPLLTVHTTAAAPLSESATRVSRFAITEAGKRVLNDGADNIALNGIDQWLGGVHLQGREKIWRWESHTSSFVRL
jgi:hypothetical protein